MSKPDGSCQKYYDIPVVIKTLNDILEWKGDSQWLGDSFHLSNIVKAAWRWGIKEGTSKEYDARKFIYSGCRLLMKYAGVQAVRETIYDILDDPQFEDSEYEKQEEHSFTAEDFERAARANEVMRGYVEEEKENDPTEESRSEGYDYPREAVRRAYPPSNLFGSKKETQEG